MKLSDSGQMDRVLAQRAGWTLDDEDETSKLVCEFWIWKSFISKKIQDIRGVSKDTLNKPKESSKVNTRPGKQRYAS